MLTRLADGSVMKGGKRRANRREVNIYAEFAKQSTRRARAGTRANAIYDGRW